MSRFSVFGLVLLMGCLVATSGFAQNGGTVITAQSRGARGDGVKDDTAALRKLFTRIPVGAEVTLDLGSGTYLVSGSQTNAACGSYVLGLGVTTMLPATVHVVGNGARIITNQKTSANLFAIVARFSTLTVEGITFERKEIALPSDTGFTGGPGVYLTDGTPQSAVASVSFQGCTFINCHRAITAGSRFMNVTGDLNNPYFATAGLLKELEVTKCSFLYPYGSNSTNANGGSQAFYSGNWVGETVVTGCHFDGAVNGSVARSPNHRPKDGFLFGEPLHLTAKGNSLAHFGMEGIATGTQAGLAFVAKAFAMPGTDAGKGSRVTILTTGHCAVLKAGQRIWYPGGGYLRVARVRSDTQVDVFSTGAKGNAARGTVVPSGRFLTLPVNFASSWARIENNTIDGGVLTGSPVLQCGRPGIRVDDLRAVIRKNRITALGGIILEDAGKSYPVHQAQYGGVVSGNTIHLLDASRPYKGVPMPGAQGLTDYGYDGVTVQKNTIVLATNKNAQGVVVNNTGIQISDNQISAQAVATGTIPSVGVFIGNVGKLPTAKTPVVEGNTFSLLDIGIGTNNGQSNAVIVGPGNVYDKVADPLPHNGLEVMQGQ